MGMGLPFRRPAAVVTGPADPLNQLAAARLRAKQASQQPLAPAQPAGPTPIAPTAPKPAVDPQLDALAQQRMQLNRGAIGGLGQGPQQQAHAFGGGTPGIPHGLPSANPDPSAQLGNRTPPQLQQPTPPAPTRAPTLTAGGMDLPPVDVRAAADRIQTGAGKRPIDASKYAQPSAPAPNADLDELALLRQQQAADKAKLQEQAAARAGFSGGGLSGSTSAMMGDLSRTTDRTNNQAIIDTEKAQADRKFKEVQRNAVLDSMELADDHDYNKDGTIAGQKIGGVIGNDNPDDNPGAGPANPKPAAKGKSIVDTSGSLTGDIGGIDQDVIDAGNAIAKYLGFKNGVGVDKLDSKDQVPQGSNEVTGYLLAAQAIPGVGPLADLVAAGNVVYMGPDGHIYVVPR